jgi:hypothetical protein
MFNHLAHEKSPQFRQTGSRSDMTFENQIICRVRRGFPATPALGLQEFRLMMNPGDSHVTARVTGHDSEQSGLAKYSHNDVKNKSSYGLTSLRNL